MPPRKKVEVAKLDGASEAGTASQPSPAPARVAIDYQRLSKVTRVMKLAGIDMLEMAFKSFVDPRTLSTLPEGSETAVSQGLVDARWFRSDAQLDVVLGFQVVTHLRVPEVAGHRDLFSLGARYLISYVLPEGFQIEGDENEIMADLVLANGQINAFPYFRQLVVEHTARGGWPPLTLDVFRAPATRQVNIVRNAPPVATTAA